MTREEFDNMKFPALVRAIAKSHKYVANSLDSHKGQKNGEFIVYFKDMGSLYSVPQKDANYHPKRYENGFTWAFEYLKIVQFPVYSDLDIILDIEKSL